MSFKDPCKAKKVFVRNTERNEHKSKKDKNCAEGSDVPFESQSTRTVSSKKDKLRTITSNKGFSDPGLNSSKAIIKQIRRVEEMVHKKCEDINDADFITKIVAEKEISKKLNFHFNDKIYRDLVALNISESDVASRVRKKTSTPSYISKLTKDIEPNLDDFYEDRPEADSPVLPTTPNIKYSPVVKYNGRDIYERIVSWESH